MPQSYCEEGINRLVIQWDKCHISGRYYTKVKVLHKITLTHFHLTSTFHHMSLTIYLSFLTQKPATRLNMVLAQSNPAQYRSANPVFLMLTPNLCFSLLSDCKYSSVEDITVLISATRM
jgi:hypothetical protein